MAGVIWKPLQARRTYSVVSFFDDAQYMRPDNPLYIHELEPNGAVLQPATTYNTAHRISPGILCGKAGGECIAIRTGQRGVASNLDVRIAGLFQCLAACVRTRAGKQ